MSDATAFTDFMAKKALGQRGKTAENEVRKALQKLQDHYGTRFAFERVADARAGSLKSAAGDFRAIFRPKNGGFGIPVSIEVKQTLETSRLPKKNFSRDSIARCYIRSLAGEVVRIIIFHSKTGRWVVMPIDVFYEEDIPSWNTAPYSSFDCAQDAVEHALRAVLI